MTQTDAYLQVTIRLYGALRQHRPVTAAGAPHEPFSITLRQGQTVAAVVTLLHIPPEHVNAIAVNGQQASPETKLHNEDTVYLFPPVAGG